MSIRGNDQKIQNSAVFWLLLDIRERWIKTRARQTLSKNGRTSTLLSQLSLEGETHTLAFHWGIFFFHGRFPFLLYHWMLDAMGGQKTYLFV